MNLLDDIFVVIVLFRQNFLECNAFQSLTRALGKTGQAPPLMIYDNSPERQVVHAPVVPWTFTYFHNPLNPGVSKAYNEASQLANGLRRKWMLLADQDTEFPETLFSDYDAAISRHPSIHVFTPILSDRKGQVSPFQLNGGKGKRISSLEEGVHSFDSYKIINSGMLVSVTAFAEAGGYDERFPLDYSDLVFTERLSVRFPAFALVRSHCTHHLSSTMKKEEVSSLHIRFKAFCDASFLYKRISTTRVNLGRVVLPRALRLFMQTLDAAFLKSGFRILTRKQHE